MTDFILSRVALISWSIILLKTNITPGQDWEFCLYFRVQIKILKIFKTSLNNCFWDEVHFVGVDHNKHSTIFCKIHWSSVFFSVDESYFDQNITFFASSFVAILQTNNLFFVFKNKNYCYLCRFYHRCAFDLLIWFLG